MSKLNKNVRFTYDGICMLKNKIEYVLEDYTGARLIINNLHIDLTDKCIVFGTTDLSIIDYNHNLILSIDYFNIITLSLYDGYKTKLIYEF